MRTTVSRLRKMIRKVIQEHAHGIKPEPAEGYVQDHADMYADSAEGWDGYLEFGQTYGYDEDQLGEWFDAAEDALFRAGRDSYEPDILRGKADIKQLEDDLESGRIDLVKNPYALD